MFFHGWGSKVLLMQSSQHPRPPAGCEVLTGLQPSSQCPLPSPTLQGLQKTVWLCHQPPPMHKRAYLEQVRICLATATVASGAHNESKLLMWRSSVGQLPWDGSRLSAPERTVWKVSLQHPGIQEGTPIFAIKIALSLLIFLFIILSLCVLFKKSLPLFF